jgi:hypothetical protein
VPARDRGPDGARTRTACAADALSLRWVVPDAARMGELEFACSGFGGNDGRLAPGDDVVAWNLATRAERCARVPADGRLFLPLATDLGDPIELTVYRGAVVTDFGACARPADAPVRATISMYEVGEGDCAESCGHVPADVATAAPSLRRYVRGAALVAPAAGLGLRRQTAELRRFLQLAQAAVDPADPINYAPLFFLRPRTERPRPLLTMVTAGDTDVPVSAGYAFARAAGLIPFATRATGTTLDDFTAPAPLLERYGGRTPNAVLLENYAVEGLARLERHPVPGGARYVFDADDLDEGRLGLGEANLRPPMRLVRVARSVRATDLPFLDENAAARDVATVWQPQPGEPLAAFVNAFIAPEGRHTFLPSDPSRPWDAGLYLTNLVARFFTSNGTDVVYFTDPTGHQCLADSSCAFIPRE